MSWPGDLARKIGMLRRGRQFKAELDEEMRLHLELRQQQNIEAGMASDEARRAAKLRFGNTALLKEESHIAWGWDWLEQFAQDAAYGMRAMLRSPGVTTVALLSLALGIGANTAIFSLIDALLLRSLPVRSPQELVIFGDGLNNGIADDFPDNTLFSYPFFREMQKRNEVFTDLAASSSLLNLAHGTVEGRSEPEPMHIKLVSGSYFPTLGVQAVIGRTLREEDDRIKDAHPVAVLNYEWWKQRLGADPNVLGKKLTIGSAVFTVVGVAPREFFGNEVGESPDMWMPLAMQKEIPPGYDGYADSMSEFLHLVGRLKPGVSMAQAGANVNVMFRQILRGLPNVPLNAQKEKELENTRVDLQSFALGFSRLRVKFSEPLKILMAVVALVLLIASGNIANLLLARSTARARELAMRLALGARRLRLIRQLLTESLVLALAGGALGIGFAMVANRILLHMISGSDPVPLAVPLNLRLLLFALGVTIATALLFGTAPAFRATDVPLTSSLKEGRTPTALGSKPRLARALIVSQVALSLVLLTGAGLFLRSFINLTRVDTGFNRDGVLLFRLDPASAGYRAGDARMNTFYQQIEDRVGVLPGVRAVSFSLFTFDEGTWNNSIWVQGYMNGHQDCDVHHNVVGNGYFATMGIPLLEGRVFEPRDTAASQRVGIVSESMARNLFPQGSPIGRHYGIHDPQNANSIEVIGVVKDVKVHGVDEKLQYVDYLSRAQTDFFYLNDLEVRYAGDQGIPLSEVRQSIQNTDPNLAISSVRTLEQQVAESMPNQRLIAQLSVFFGLLAVFLSCIGIYGLMSYVVTRRTNEIGIRMALGGKRSDMLWLVMREILLLLAIGVGIGVPVTVASGRAVSSVLFGLRGTDLISLVAAVGTLMFVAALAGYLPARRASFVDPMVALRHE